MAGLIKDMACRELLLTLQRKNLLDYPPPKMRQTKKRKGVQAIEVDQTSITSRLPDLEPVTVRMVRHTKLEPLYDSLINQHHYLGYTQIIGNHLKYISFSKDTPVACIGWELDPRSQMGFRCLGCQST